MKRIYCVLVFMLLVGLVFIGGCVENGFVFIGGGQMIEIGMSVSIFIDYIGEIDIGIVIIIEIVIEMVI